MREIGLNSISQAAHGQTIRSCFLTCEARGVRFVENDRLSTAADYHGIDLALRVVERYFGRPIAQIGVWDEDRHTSWEPWRWEVALLSVGPEQATQTSPC